MGLNEVLCLPYFTSYYMHMILMLTALRQSLVVIPNEKKKLTNKSMTF